MNSLLRIIFTLMLFFGGYALVSGQVLTNNNIQVTINTGAQLTVKGDIVNTAGTTIHNNGTIDLTGNWTNNTGTGCFGISTGSVILNGNAQSINGTDETIFNNLVVAGTGQKIMQINTTTGGGNVAPSGVLDLVSGSLDLNSNRLLVTNPGSGAVNGSGGYILSEDTDHSSRVVWQIHNTSGSHTIPFGNASGILIPFTFDLTSGSAGDITVSTYASAPDNTPYPVTPTLVTHVRDMAGANNSANTIDRYWEINTTGNPVATLTFTYAAAENAATGNAGVRAQRWRPVGEAWEFPLPGQFNPGLQSVTVPGVNQFGAWALAIGSSPLPVELLSFTATAKDNQRVLCEWTTASETNNDFFTVERSRDGSEFEPVGIVDGAGNSSSAIGYTFTDPSPYTGISYYRLRQTDFDGTFTFSEIRKVYIHAGMGSDLIVYPNPAAGMFYLEIKSGRSNDLNPVLELFDMNGKLVLKPAMLELKRNTNTVFEVDVTNLNPAMYFYRVYTNNEIIGHGRIEIITNW